MFELDMLTVWALSWYGRARGDDPERGDVPGWVMVTVMTAGLVVLVFAAFRDSIDGAIQKAVDQVTGGN